MNCGEPKFISGLFYRTGDDIGIRSRKTAEEKEISQKTQERTEHT